jgi:hypothetical protein
MQAARSSVVRLGLVLVCGGAAAAVLAACDAVDADIADEGEAGGAGEEAAGGAPSEAPAESSAESALAGCTTHVAGGGFGNLTLQLASTLAITDLEATPASNPALDGVIAMSRGAATSFNALATSVRFSTAGVLDARDGTAYRADASIPFTLGQARKLRIVADVPSHTFSVYVDLGYYTERLAKRYAFRSTTATVTGLDRLAAIVDGAAGQLSICNVVATAPTAIAYSREGAYGVVPLASDRALASDGSTVTLRLAANGAVLNQIAVGGELAADPTERAYVARVSGTQLAVYAYTAALALRWSRLDPIALGSRVLAAAADGAGVTLALADAGGTVSIVRYPEAGGAGTVLATGGTHAAVAPDGFAVATATSSAYDVSVFGNSGALLWTQSFPGAVGARLEVMTLGLGGRVVLGGHYYAPITFGGPTLDLVPYDVNVNTYLVGLDRATGAHVFTNRVNATRLTGAGGNGARLVITGERVVTPIFPDLWQYDASGAPVGGAPWTGFNEDWGRSGRVAIGAGNRIYWERSMVWPTPTSVPYPYLLALRP